MKRLIELTVVIICLFSCNKPHDYGKEIIKCYEENRARNKESGYMKNVDDYEKNMFRDCLKENVIGLDFPNITLTSTNGEVISLYEIDKPIFLQVFNPKINDCLAQVPAINEFAKKYSDKVSFIIVIDKKYDKISNDENNIPFHESIIIVNGIDDKTGKTIHSKDIKIMGFPTTYFLTKEKYISDLETANCDMYYKGIIKMKERYISTDSLIYKSTRRYKDKLEILIE